MQGDFFVAGVGQDACCHFNPRLDMANIATNMNFSPGFLLEVIIALGSGFGAYAAIRPDLATLHERAGDFTA